MISSLLKKGSGGWFFLGGVTALYVGVILFNPHLGMELVSKALSIFTNLIPIFFIVFLFMVFSSLVFDSEKVLRAVGEESGTRGWLVSVAGGILSTGPVYMWYPLLADLREKGMRTSLIATFLYNRAVKIPLLPLMIYYFGLPFTVVLTCYIILSSIINGMLVERFLR